MILYTLSVYYDDLGGYEFYDLGVFDSFEKANEYVNEIEEEIVVFKDGRASFSSYTYYEITKTELNKRLNKENTFRVERKKGRIW